MKKLLKMNLRFFGEGDSDPNNAGDNNQQTTTNTQTSTGTTINLDEAERIATQREERARNSALKSYFEQQGMTREETDEAIRQLKEKRASETPDPQKLQSLLDDEKKLSVQAITKANQRLISAEAMIQAAALGVNPDRVKHLLKLADLSSVEVGDDGNIDSELVKTALEAILTDFPELKGTGTPASGGGANPGSQTLTKGEEYVQKIKEAREKGNNIAVIRLKREAAAEGIYIN